MYYIDPNITSKELISINNTQKNWGMLDYVHYYASLGNRTYIRLENICKRYNMFGLKIVLTAITGKYVTESTTKNGELEFTDEEFERGEIALEFIKHIRDNIKNKIIAKDTFFFLVMKTYYLDDIDRDRLSYSIINRYGTENYGSALQCAMAIEHFYNFKLKTYRYISNEIIPRR